MANENFAAQEAVRDARGSQLGDEADFHLQLAQVHAILAVADAVEELTETLKSKLD